MKRKWRPNTPEWIDANDGTWPDDDRWQRLAEAILDEQYGLDNGH